MIIFMLFLVLFLFRWMMYFLILMYFLSFDEYWVMLDEFKVFRVGYIFGLMMVFIYLNMYG